MSLQSQAQTQVVSKLQSSSIPMRARLLQRKCACGGTPGVDGECEECRNKRLSSQRQASQVTLQTKLTVNKPGDRYEKEADQVAEQVMRMPAPEQVSEGSGQTEGAHIQYLHTDRQKIHRQPEKEDEDEELRRQPMAEEEDEENLQAKEASSQTPTITPALQMRINSLRSGGQPLPRSIRSFMEPRFGHDFSQVRIHTDAQAAETALAVHARVYTVGRDIIFGAGEYAPETTVGKRLLAHELTHVVQQQNHEINLRNNRLGRVELRQSILLQRKLALYSKGEEQAFKWFLTPNDAANYSVTQGKPLDVTMKSAQPNKIDDSFRFNILKTIINNPTETLLIRGFGLDENVTAHQLYKNGKLDKVKVSPTLRAMGGTLVGAGGVTIPSANLALATDNNYSGPVTGIANESWIFYSTPTSLAHEFGHALLLFSGTSWRHGKDIPSTAGILTPEGKPYGGPVNVFIDEFVAEKYAQLVLLDPEALHFSPTVVRKWPEPPDYKLTFTGTWLQFLAKYPGAEVSQKAIELKGGKKERQLRVCIPKRGENCPP